MEIKNREILPETRILLFDSSLFINDIITPLKITLKPATVIRRYGYKSKYFGNYPDLIDVIFDHKPNKISKAHFTYGAIIIKED